MLNNIKTTVRRWWPRRGTLTATEYFIVVAGNGTASYHEVWGFNRTSDVSPNINIGSVTPSTSPKLGTVLSISMRWYSPGRLELFVSANKNIDTDTIVMTVDNKDQYHLIEHGTWYKLRGMGLPLDHKLVFIPGQTHHIRLDYYQRR